jgi:tripartite-type tricarboxylate transporter receptor subunit TctC
MPVNLRYAKFPLHNAASQHTMLSLDSGNLRALLGFISILAVLGLAPGAARAEDFYRGKTLRLIVPSDVGGGYDSYARTFAQHVRRHIPGEPAIVVQNMPGGGGLLSANWLYNIAPKDGLAIALFQRGVPFYPFFGDKNALFLPTRLNWIGSFNAEIGVTTLWHTAKAQTLADAFNTTVVLGGSGPNDSETYPNLMNNTIGTKFRIVSGYRANTAVLLAMERGEVEGVTGSWSSMKAERPNWLRDRLVRLLVQIGRARHRDLPDVPLIMDFVSKPEDKAMWNVITTMATVGRPIAAPPGTPAELVGALRAAFAATMKDAAFIGEMERTRRELSPESGEAMQQMLEEVAATPPDTLAKLIAYTRKSDAGSR